MSLPSLEQIIAVANEDIGNDQAASCLQIFNSALAHNLSPIDAMRIALASFVSVQRSAVEQGTGDRSK